MNRRQFIQNTAVMASSMALAPVLMAAETDFPVVRIPEAKRRFKSAAVERTIAQVQSSIDLVNNDGDDARRTIEVDWLLRLVPRGQGASPVQRQQKVKCVLEKRGRKWQIESLDPVQFLAWP